MKQNILKLLSSIGLEVIVVPCNLSYEEIMKFEPDGIFLSNGPGDPFATASHAVKIIKKLIKILLKRDGCIPGMQAFLMKKEDLTFLIE